MRKPIPILLKSVGGKVKVKLKNGATIGGPLKAVDPQMNMVVEDAKEYASEDPHINYGTAFIRGNNILWVQLEEQY